MKVLKKGLLGFLKYFGAFIGSVVCVVAVMIASHLMTRSPKDETQTPSGTATTSAIEKIMDKLESMENGEFSIDFKVDVEGIDTIQLSTDVLVSPATVENQETKPMSASTAPAGTSIQINGNVSIGEQATGFEVIYINNVIYADFDGIFVKLETTNFIQSIEDLLKLNMFSSLNFNMSLSSLNWETIKGMIVGFGSAARAQEFEGGLKTDMAIMSYGTISFITDIEYNLEEVIIEKIVLEGVEIAGGVKASVNNESPKKIKLPANADKATDITHVTDIVASVDKLLTKGNIQGKVNLNIKGEEFVGDYLVDFSDGVKAYFETTIASQRLSIRYIDNKVFVSYDDLKYFINLDNFNLAEMISSATESLAILGYDMPKISAEKVEPAQILGLFSYVGDIKLNEEGISLAIEKGSLKISIRDGEFDTIEISYSDFVSLNASLREEVSFDEIVENEYFDIKSLGETINNVAKQFKEKRFATEIKLNVNDIEILANAYVDFQDELKARFFGSYGEYNFEIIYKSNSLYVTFNDIKIEYELPQQIDIEGLVQTVVGLAQEYVPDFEMPQIEMPSIEMIADQIDYEQIIDTIRRVKILNASVNYIDVELDGAQFKLFTNNGEVASIVFGTDDNSVKLEILSNNFEIEPTGKYLKINDTLEYVPAIINLIQSQKLQITTEIKLGEITLPIVMKVDFSNGIVAHIQTEILNEEMNIYFENDTIYVEVGSLAISGTIEEIMQIADEAIATESTSSDKAEIESQKLTLDLLKEIVEENGMLNIILEMGLTISLEKENDVLTGIELAYEDKTIAFTLTTFEGSIEHELKAEYETVTEIYTFVNAIAELANKEKIAFDVEVNYAEVSVIGEVMNENSKFSAHLETTIASQKLAIDYYDNKIFVAYDDLKYYIDLSDFEINAEELGSIIQIAKDSLLELGYELPELEEVEIGKEELIGLLSYIHDVKFTTEEVSIGIEKGILTFLLANDSLDEINFEYLDIANIRLSVNEGITFASEDYTDYIDIRTIEETIKSFVNQFTEGRLAAQINVNVNDVELSARIFADYKSDIKARIEASYGDYSFEVIYKSNYVYLTFNDIKISYEIPTDIDFEELAQIVVGLAHDYIPNFEMPQIEMPELESILSKVDFDSIIEKIKKIQVVNASVDHMEIAFENINFKLLTNNGKIENISFSYDDNSVELEILSNNFEIEPTGKYLKINDTLEYVPAIINLIQSRKLQITTEIKLGEITLPIVMKVDFSNGIVAHIQTEILDEEVNIYFENDTIYVEVGSLAISGTIEEITKLMEDAFVKQETDCETQKLTLDFLKEIVEEDGMLNIILEMGLTISLEKENDVLTGIELAYEDKTIAFTLTTFEGSIEHELKAEYETITEVYDFAMTMLKFIQNETLAFEIEMNYEEFVVTGKVMYKDGAITAYLETEIANRILKLNFKDNQIYVDFDGLRITCKLDEIEELVDYVTTYAGIDLGEIQNHQPETDISFNTILNNIILDFANEIATIEYEGLKVQIDTIGKVFNKIQLGYEGISAEITPCDEFDFEVYGNYIDLFEIKELSKAVYNSLKNLSISGTIDVVLELFGEENNISVDYAIGFVDERIIGHIETEFKGLNINLYIDGEDIYIYVVGLKIHFNINDRQELVDWINETFNADLSLDFIDDTLDSFETMKLDLITSVETNEGLTHIVFKNGMTIDLQYGDTLETIYFNDGTRVATITCTDFSTVNIDSLDKESYRDYKEFTSVIEDFYSLAMSTKFNLDVKAQIYDSEKLSTDIGADVQLDVTSGLNAYVDLTGLGEQITLYYEEKVLYFCYAGTDGLKISIKEHAIQEILAILLSAMNFDTSSIPYLDEILEKEDINTDNIGSLMPEIEFGNPLSYLTYINSFEVTDDFFAVNLKAELLSSEAEGKDVSIKVYYDDEKITKLEINNLYISKEQKINATIDLLEFTGVQSPENKETYIDLSNSSDLIKALVNTSQLNDYHINGKIKLNVDIGVNFDAATLNVDAKIKKEKITESIVDQVTGEVVQKTRDEITGIITLDNYPLILAVNNANTNGAGMVGSLKRVRKITIVLKGNYAYLMTSDDKWGLYDKLDRATKVTTNYLLNNLEYYMQYLLGFTDTIQTEINAAIEESRNYTGPTNYGNIIKEYTLADGTHKFVINLAEVAHSSDLGDLTLRLNTINNECTGNKDYLYRMDVDVQFLNGMISLKTDSASSSEALFLVDIGKQVEMTECNNFINDYDVTNKLGVDGEYEREDNGAWHQANTGTTTVTFYSDGEVIAESTGAIASRLELPTPTKKFDNGIYIVEYKFLGWFMDESFATEFTTTYYPRYNTNLVAKWDEGTIIDYVKINFVTNQEGLAEKSMKLPEGAILNLPEYENIEEVVNANKSILYIFNGWLDKDGRAFTSATIPYVDPSNRDSLTSPTEITLYASWTKEETSTYTLQIYYNGEQIKNGSVPGDRVFDLTSLNTTTQTRYTAGKTKVYDVATGNEVTDFNITGNYTWEIKNPFEATATYYIYSSGVITAANTFKKTYSGYNGDQITLDDLSSKNYTDKLTNYDIDYSFVGYKYTIKDASGNDVTCTITANSEGKYVLSMPAQKVIVYAVWEETRFFWVSFDTTWVKPKDWEISNRKNYYSISDMTTNCTNVRVQATKDENGNYTATFNPSGYDANISYVYSYKLVITYKGKYHFFVGTWKTEVGNTCCFSSTPADASSYTEATNIPLTGNTTLYAVWDATFETYV